MNVRAFFRGILTRNRKSRREGLFKLSHAGEHRGFHRQFIAERLESRVFLTNVPGQTINTAVILTAANSPYTLTGYVTVGAGGSLTIQSGVTVAHGYALTIATGGSISASNVDFACNFTAQQGATGSVSGSSFNGPTEFDNTGVTTSNDTFSVNPSVYPTYIPTLVGNGNSFAIGTEIDIQGATLNTPLTLPVVTNVADYTLIGYETIGSGGVLTVNSGVTVAHGYALTIATGGSISASNVDFACNFTAQQGATGNVSGSSFNGPTEFDNTGITTSNDTFSVNPSVYPTYIPTLVGNGDSFATGTVIDIQGATLNTPLTLPVVTNVADYTLIGYETIGSGGVLTVNSGVTVAHGYALTIATGGSISASNVDFACNFTAQQGATGSVSGSSFNGPTEFDDTGVTTSNDTFATDPSVYPTYIPTLVGNGNSFVTGTVIDIQGATLNTPLTLPVVTNVANYTLIGYETVGSGGALTVNSGVTVAHGYVLTIATGGSISASNVDFACNFTAQQGATGSVSGSSFNGPTEFDNTGVTTSNDTFSVNPSVYPTYIPTLVGNGDSFATGTVIDIQGATLNTPLTLPVVTNVADYTLTGYETVGSGGDLTINSGVTLAHGYVLTVDSGGAISADGASLACNLDLDGTSSVFIENCDLSGAPVTSQGNGGPIPLGNNWWGTTVISSVQADITDQSDNASLPAVTYLPLLPAKPTLQSVASTISLGASTNSGNSGDAVTFTATLIGTAGAAPTGAVSFVANDVYLGIADVTGGAAAFTTTALPTGSDQVTAVYGGDVNYSGANSAPALVSVAGVVLMPSATSLGSSTSQATQGTQVTLTATVSGIAQTPTGMVTFAQDGNVLGTAQVQENGTAELATSSLPVGVDAIVAMYSGDANYSASTSSSVTVDVSAPATTSASTVSVTSTSPTAAFGAAVTLAATVSSASGSGPTPTGAVTFLNGGSEIGASPLDANGQASITISSLPAGTDVITASYAGDGNYSASTSSPGTQTILPPSPIQSALGGVILPPAIVGGQKFKGKATVILTNQGAKIDGIVQVQLYASDATSLDGSQVPVAAMSKKLTLRAGASAKFVFTLKSLPSSLANGTYYLISQITDPNQNMSTSAASQAIQIAAPFVEPTVSVGAVTPGAVALNKTASISIAVTNNGNVAATGLSAFLGVSSDGATQVAGITLATGASHVKLAPGKSTKLKLHFKLTAALQASLAAGSYFPFVNVTLGGVTASLIGTSPFTAG